MDLSNMNLFIKNKKPIISIDIGDKNLKILLLEEREGLISLDKREVYYIANIVREGIILDSDVIVGYINSFVERYNLIQPELIISYPNKGRESNTKIIKMKTLENKKEMKNAIDIEVEDIFRIDVSKNKLQHGIISNDFQNSSLVYAQSYNLEVLNSYLDFANKLKYSYKIIPKNLFLGNIIENKEVVTLVIDIGYNSTDFIVYKDNLPLVVRSIDIGGFSIDTILATYKEISFDESETLKKNKGVILLDRERESFLDEEQSLSDIIGTQIDTFINEINRIIDTTYSEYDLNIEDIKLLGGTSNLKKLDNYIKETTNIPCSHFYPSFVENQEKSILCLILSISLLNISLSGQNIDFLVASKKQMDEVLIKNVTRGIAAVTCCIALFFCMGALTSNIFNTLSIRKLNKVESNYSEFTSKSTEYRNIIKENNKIINNKNEILNTIQEINKVEFPTHELMLEVKKKMPKKIQLDTFDLFNNTLKITGIVDNHMNLGYFLKELETSNWFEEIKFEYIDVLTDIDSKQVKNLKFYIELSVNKDPNTKTDNKETNK